MKMIKGIAIILLFYFLGEFLSKLISGFVPGSIIGMLLLFICLCYKLVSPNTVSGVANAFTKNMAIFFIPAGVGLMGSYGLISKFWSSILIVCTISTALVLIVVALIQQYMENRREETK